MGDVARLQSRGVVRVGSGIEVSRERLFVFLSMSLVYTYSGHVNCILP